jgi:putative hydrolase of the HAD superfamily
MPLQAVFLDLGNTLLREEPSRAELYAASGRARGLSVTAERMRELMAETHAGLPRELDGAFRYSDPWFLEFQRRIFVERLGLAQALFEPLSRELFERFEAPRSFALYPRARELLARLRARGLVLGLVSNWSARLPRLLARLALEQDFDFVLCSAIERLEKPEAGIFQRALERAGVPAADALHAGDHPERDARGALALGLQAVLVDHAGQLPAAARALCPWVATLQELGDLILERA